MPAKRFSRRSKARRATRFARGPFKAPQVSERILQGLRSSSMFDRALAVEALCKYGSKHEKVVTGFISDKSAYVREVALGVLFRINSKKYSGLTAAKISDPDPNVCAHAIFLSGKAKNKKAIPAIRFVALNSKADAHARSMAVVTLASVFGINDAALSKVAKKLAPKSLVDLSPHFKQSH